MPTNNVDVRNGFIFLINLILCVNQFEANMKWAVQKEQLTMALDIWNIYITKLHILL